ncbi:MAG: hypothetical protein GYB67_15285 [Chloroflexi bacterium]|nr:hypothetical protein [Chloroflexota bacterium]
MAERGSPIQRITLGVLGIEIVLVLLFAYGFYRWTFEWRLNGPQTDATRW